MVIRSIYLKHLLGKNRFLLGEQPIHYKMDGKIKPTSFKMLGSCILRLVSIFDDAFYFRVL